MYSKQEASQLRQQFWTVFGQYMAPVLSAEGLPINWVNYKTGEKDIYFRMDAHHQRTIMAIEIRCKDIWKQQLIFGQFQQLKTLLQQAMGEEWIWQLHEPDEYGNLLSRIYHQLECVSILKKEDWPQIISFFKPRIIALDYFWSTAKYIFETL